MKNFILFLFIELLLCQYIFADVFSKTKVLKIGSSEIKKMLKLKKFHWKLYQVNIKI
ncbi:MAG: hypothetical protein Q7K21_05440 [Elusimicrobiota bacterium]|nr:hypothetical protein [Elusimicrobiota bacterium]